MVDMNVYGCKTQISFNNVQAEKLSFLTKSLKPNDLKFIILRQTESIKKLTFRKPEALC